MSMLKFVCVALFTLLVGCEKTGGPLALSATSVIATETPDSVEIKTHGGSMLSEAEISTHQITIYSDGRNLPDGQGTAEQGNSVYALKCLMCHGAKGEGVLGTRLVGREGYQEGSKDVMTAMSVGAWPSAPTIFDYVRRAMPHFSPKTLSDDEVYQLTAWILKENDIIGASDVMNKDTLPKVTMPTTSLTINVYEQEGQN